jgi:hypothetical protein
MGLVYLTHAGMAVYSQNHKRRRLILSSLYTGTMLRTQMARSPSSSTIFMQTRSRISPRPISSSFRTDSSPYRRSFATQVSRRKKLGSNVGMGCICRRVFDVLCCWTVLKIMHMNTTFFPSILSLRLLGLYHTTSASEERSSYINCDLFE